MAEAIVTVTATDRYGPEHLYKEDICQVLVEPENYILF